MLLFLWYSVAHAQQTPQQIINNSAPFGAFSSQQLEQADVYLLSSLGVPQTPSQIASNAAPFGSYSDMELQQAQTYLLSQLAATGTGTGSNSVVLVHNGGSTAYPTITTAINAAVSNDVIRISGIFNESIALQNGIGLIGDGPGLTVIAGTNLSMVSPANNNYIANLTVRATDSTGAYQYNVTSSGESTNTTFFNVEISGYSDGIFIQQVGAVKWKLYGCNIHTHYDAININQGLDPITPGNETNTVMEVYNCAILASWDGTPFSPYTGLVRAINCRYGAIRVYGGSLTALNGTNQTVALQLQGNTGVAEVGGAVLKASATSGAQSTATNTGGGSFTIYGSILTPASTDPTITIVGAATMVQTNWIGDQYYTNNSGRLLYVSSSVQLTENGGAGNASQTLQTGSSIAALSKLNMVGEQTLSTTLVTVKTNILGGYISPGTVFCFTNSSTGAGDSTALVPGSGQMVTY